jgi:hypothetical protein
VLRVREIWNAFDDRPSYLPMFQVQDNGIRCVRAPCFWLEETRLNAGRSVDISGTAGRLGAEARVRLGQGAIIVAGRNLHKRDGGLVVAVDQLYTRAQHALSMCAEYTTSDGRFYAKNFAGNDQQQAQAWVSAEPGVISSGIGAGTCLAVNEQPCEAPSSPVCGVPAATDVAGTYGSLCEFRKTVRAFAGADGESKGKFKVGACQGYCASSLARLPESNVLYVKSFLWAEQADAWLANTFPDVPENHVDPGLCGAQPACVGLPPAKVCGTIRSEVSSTYENACEFIRAVKSDAGNDASKGYYTIGACPAAQGPLRR